MVKLGHSKLIEKDDKFNKAAGIIKSIISVYGNIILNFHDFGIEINIHFGLFNWFKHIQWNVF